MSPRRRLVLVAAVLLLVVAGVLAVVGLRSAGGGDVVPVRQSLPGPVLLVPGYGGDAAALGRLAVALQAAGRQATVLQLPGDGTGALGDQAAVLGSAAAAAVASGAPSVDVVGYSAGGVVARLWVAEQDGGSLARRVVTLGSPHHGTDVAGLAQVFAPSSCPAACRDLAPDSDLLGRLNRGDESPEGPVWVSIWTTDDEVVTPPSSARLEGALDVVVQDRCPGRKVAHGQLPTDPAVQAMVLAVIGPGQPVAASDCPAP
ncbi:MAG: hypothetical protein LH461_08095 [Spirochaetaceae bacterium]|nr:hypothetical protein [Spirochaetaceae bacterium]